MRFAMLLILACSFLVPAQAQELYDPDKDLYPNAYTANPQYAEMAEAAMRYMPKRFDFMRFRGLYAKTRQYDPIGDEALEKLLEAAYKMENAINQQEFQNAQAEYRFIIIDHLANLGVVTQAHVLAKDKPKFYGNANFYAWVRKGLLEAVMGSREGKSLQDAYMVVTLPEETALIATLGLELIHSEPVKEGFTYYNMNDVKDLYTQKTWTLFVNTTFPMDFLSKKHSARERKFNLP